MPTTEVDSGAIKVVESEIESGNESDFDALIEDSYRFLESDTSDNENDLNHQKSPKECKTLVKSIKMESDQEVHGCNSTNEMCNKHAPSNEIELELEIKSFFDMLESKSNEVISVNNSSYNADLESESEKLVQGFCNNQPLKDQIANSEEKYIIPETDKANTSELESKILTSSKSEARTNDDDADEIYVDPIKDRNSSQPLHFSPSSNPEFKECNQLFTAELLKETKQKLAMSRDSNRFSMSDSDALSIYCESDIDESALDLEETNEVKNTNSLNDNDSFVKDSENCNEDASMCDKTTVVTKHDNEVDASEEFILVSECDGDGTLILCCESDLDESTVNECLVSISENTDIALPPNLGNACSVQMDVSSTDNQVIVKHSTPNRACAVTKIEKLKELENALFKDTKIDNELPVSQEKDTLKLPFKIHSDEKELVSEEKKAEPNRDFYEKEKDDVIDPRWQTVKELSTNEERYQQVKACWGSTTVPDPDKNVTHHSYRKKQFQKSQIESDQTKRHKRQASTKLDGNESKRLRPCTYLFDDKITAIAKEKEEQTNEIRKEMKNRIKNMEKQHFREKISMQNHLPSYNHMGYYNFNNSCFDWQLANLQHEHQRQVASVIDEYERTIDRCDANYELGIHNLNNVRNEVLQFYSFYKGASKQTTHDPTFLNDSQLRELDDIENFYSQMDNYYK